MEALVAKYWPLVIGAIAVFGTIFYNTKKVKVDESALVLAKWKEFAEIHQADMKRLRDEMDKDRTRYEAELDYLRDRVKEVERELVQVRKDSLDQIKGRDKEIKDLKEQITGLMRELSQVSQSSAVQIGRVGGKVKKMQADKTEAHDEINEHLARLDRAGDNSIPKEDT